MGLTGKVHVTFALGGPFAQSRSSLRRVPCVLAQSLNHLVRHLFKSAERLIDGLKLRVPHDCAEGEEKANCDQVGVWKDACAGHDARPVGARRHSGE